MKTWLAAALCALALGSSAALAEADTFGVGDGHNGPLTVAGPNTVINGYAQVTAALTVGSTSIPIGACTGDGCFTTGDLVLVHQTTGLTPVPASGMPDAVDLNSRPVGRWEFARVGSVTATTLELTAPLVHEYAANVTQVIRVPEYTNVTIAAGRSITAPAWDGSTGGIVAFLANGTVTNGGVINASALGFRGGQYVNDTSGSTGCSGPPALDQMAPSGAQKGEGIANTRYGATQTGRGNVANGAGGGVCFKSGGGGGGHGGAGGQGGRSTDGGNVGGLGGAALTYPLRTQLTFGGGGGAGHGSDGTGVPGGRGGGAIFIRASQLTGSGTITASGGLAGATASDGGSGGGAGGSVYLRFVSTADCAGISATGGIGGNVNAIGVGPGGGGGGGLVLFQSAGGTCSILATGSASGIQQAPAEPAYGAQPGTNGTSNVLPGGFVVPERPTIITPPNGSVTSNRRPSITGEARPGGVEVILYIDGNEAGRTTSEPSGRYSFTPVTDLSDGSHTVRAYSEKEAVRSLWSEINTFTVDTAPPDTTIVSGPSGFTRQNTATFEFSAMEESVVTYECSLNDAEFTACPSPNTYNGLAEGAYTLRVRARDAAGNVDESPATQSFRVTGADLALLGSGCSATGGDASLVLLGLGTFTALARRRRRG